MSIRPRAGRSRSPAPRRACGLILLSLTLVVVLQAPGGIEGRPHAREGPAQQRAADRDTPLEEIRRLLKDGRFSDAETRARGLLEESVGTYGASALETALVLDVLVEALWRAGKSGEPETRDLAQRAVVLKEEGLGGEDLGVATSLVNLGIVCSDGGDYAGAETAYRRALVIRERALGAEHPDVARTLNNLGVVFFHRGEYAAAREQHQRALAIREKALGPRHADVATSLSNLALVSGVTGDYAQARPLLERALAIREEALGPEHPYVSTTLSDLASVLFALGDYDEAHLSRQSAGRGANGEDGVLTAEEIASLDLSAAHWVVLSACGSGLGELRSGEGVLGLLRAFQMAGARSVIMSLWDLDDATIQRWIGALYRSRFRGVTTAGAVRAASREILLVRREAGLSTHPFFWGGFIAAGEWR